MAMRNVDSEFLAEIKSIPISDYATDTGHSFKVKRGRYWSEMDGHDSFVLDCAKNCFYWNSQNARGSIIDFVIAVGDASDSKSACALLAEKYGIGVNRERKIDFVPVVYNPIEDKKDFDGLELPEKADDNKRVYRYLYHERCIAREVLRFFFGRNMLYQDLKHSNCVFTTKRFACVRSSSPNYKFRQDVKGCDYDWGFYFWGGTKEDKPHTMIVAESVIDLMSIMSDMLYKGIGWKGYSFLAISGVSKLNPVIYRLNADESIKKVLIAFDNDEAGDKAYQLILDGFPNSDMWLNKIITPHGEDWSKKSSFVEAMKSNIPVGNGAFYRKYNPQEKQWSVCTLYMAVATEITDQCFGRGIVEFVPMTTKEMFPNVTFERLAVPEQDCKDWNDYIKKSHPND